MREIPPIKYDKDIGRLIGYYQRSYSIVVKELIRLLETDGWEQLVKQESSLARQLQFIIQENDKKVLPEIEELLRKAHVQGQAEALLQLGDAQTLSEATKGVTFSLLAQQSVQKMIEDTFEDVLQLTSRTNKRIKKQIRDTAGEVMRMNAMNQIGLDTSKKQIQEQLLKKGFSKDIKKNFVGVTDSAGRKWKLDKYVKMLVKTKISQAYAEGIRSECIERGTDLAVVSSHGAKDQCKHFEGMVISMTGATKGLYTYDELKRSNKIFHPNCEHTITPLSDIDALPESVKKKHEKQLKSAKKGKII
jgi:Phage minor capsid protein 2